MFGTRETGSTGHFFAGLLVSASLACWACSSDGPTDEGEASAEGRQRLAVVYFENTADPSDETRFGQMMTSLLATELARHDGLDVTSSQKLFDTARALGGVTIGDREQALEIGRRLDLEYLILGRLTQGSEILRAEAETLSVANGRVLASRQAETVEADGLFTLAESLAQQTREAFATPLSRDALLPPPRQTLTSSIDAYRAFVTGQDLLYRNHFQEAVETLRRAVEIDPDFMMAYSRLSNAALWVGDQETARLAASRAMELGQDLPSSERRLLEAAFLFQEGRFSEVLDRVEDILVDDPEDKEALFYAAEIYLHSGVETHPARAVETIFLLEDLDPEFRLLGNHLVVGLVLQGRWQEAETYLEAWIAEEPEKIHLRHVALGIGNRLDEIPRLPEPFRRVNDNYRLAILMLQDRWEEAEPLVFEDVGVGYNLAWRLRNRATWLTYRGRFQEAEEVYRRSASLVDTPSNEGIQNGLPASSFHALADLMVLEGDLANARQMAQEALRLQPSQPVGHYVAGRLARLDGDLAAVEVHLHHLREMASKARGLAVALYLQALEAELFLAEGQAVRARANYENVVTSGTLLYDFYSAASSSGAWFHQGLAEACRGIWDQECEAQALGDLVAGGFERLDHPILYVEALFRLGELRLEAGDETAAEEYFRQVVEYWGEADREIPTVVAAHEHLAP